MDLIFTVLLSLLLILSTCVKLSTILLSRYFKANEAFQISLLLAISTFYLILFDILEIDYGILMSHIFISFGFVSYIISVTVTWMMSDRMASSVLQIRSFQGYIVSLFLFTLFSLFFGQGNIDSTISLATFYIIGSSTIGLLGGFISNYLINKNIDLFIIIREEES